MLTDPARRSEVVRRVELIRALTEARGGTAALLWSRRTFAWLTLGGLNHVAIGTEIGAAPLLVTRREVVAISPNIEAGRLATEELAGLPIEPVAVPWWEPGAIGSEAARRAGGRLLSDVDLEDALVPVRSRLGVIEQDRMAAIGAAVATALDGALRGVVDGTTESELVAMLEARLEGFRTPVLLAAADERIERFRHPLPTDSPIQRRVMLVVVAERWGLHVAATRFRELVPPSAQLAATIEATRRVEAAIHGATRPGATLGEAFDAARAAYAAAGVPDEWQLHHQGGTIGYQGRERIAVPGDPTRIESGMAFAWNPSITGAKAEDTFVLAASGARRVVTAASDDPQPVSNDRLERP
jgi:Xaa-Pro aminopeptidase